MSPLRLLAGLVGAFIAAVSVCVALSCGYALLIVTAHGAASSDVGGSLLFIGVSAAIVSAQIALLAIALAVPHVVISQRLQRTSKSYFILSGTVVGLIAVAAAGIWQRRLPAPTFHMGEDQYFLVVTAVVSGAVSALVYRKIAYRGLKV